MCYCSKSAKDWQEKNGKKNGEDKLTFQVNLDTFPMEISSYGRQGSMGNFAHVSGHEQCLLFLSFDTPGGCVGAPIV